MGWYRWSLLIAEWSPRRPRWRFWVSRRRRSTGRSSVFCLASSVRSLQMRSWVRSALCPVKSIGTRARVADMCSVPAREWQVGEQWKSCVVAVELGDSIVSLNSNSLIWIRTSSRVWIVWGASRRSMSSVGASWDLARDWSEMEFARRRVESASTTMENLGNDARTEAKKVDWGRQNSQLKNLSSQKNSEIR